MAEMRLLSEAQRGQCVAAGWIFRSLSNECNNSGSVISGARL